MKFGIIGNNDGPLQLLKALQGTSFEPQFIGLQNRVSKALTASYKNERDKITFFQDFDEQKLLERMESFDIDVLINCFCSFRFDELLSQSFEVLNIHLSPLPIYRGRHPLHWALINGKSKFGVSIHKVNTEYNAGDIYWQKTTPIDEGMSVAALRNKLMDILQLHFTHFLQKYQDGSLETIKNNDEKATYISCRQPNDSRLNEWNNSQLIYRKVNALRSEDHPAYVNTGKMKIPCHKANLGVKIDHDMKRPFIYEIDTSQFQIVCLDGKSIWLHCPPDKLKYLNLGQNF